MSRFWQPNLPCQKSSLTEEVAKFQSDVHVFQRSLQCGKVYTLKQSLSYHIKSVHHQDKPFKCPMCQKAFSSSSNLNGHLVIHEDKRAALPCEHCSKTFMTLRSLRCHMKSNHTGGKRATFDCSQCDKKLLSWQGLDSHRRSIHEKEEHPCQICSKVFKTKGFLRRHTNSFHLGKNRSGKAEEIAIGGPGSSV